MKHNEIFNLIKNYILIFQKIFEDQGSILTKIAFSFFPYSVRSSILLINKYFIKK